jgi:catechol 2,3-dioxygenase-like lactoylglutathione lyase family enzyme
MDVLFVASVSPIVADVDAANVFYRGGLGLSFEGNAGDYAFTDKLPGVKHFGLWPLSEAAQACFGTPTWPAEVPVPQASIEFEVGDVAAAAAELEAKGHRLLHGARTEPWTQVTARLLSPEGLLVAVCYTPWFHADTDADTGADPEASGQVLAALYRGDRDGAEVLGAGAALDLFAAAALGRAERVGELLATAPDAVSGHTADGFTALHLAAFFGSPDVVALLLAAGADVTAVAANPSAVTPLHSAAAQQSEESVRLLLEAGAPVDAQQTGGFTALHAAARHGDHALAELLLAHGATRGVTDDDGRTAAEHALERGFNDLAAELAPAGA